MLSKWWLPSPIWRWTPKGIKPSVVPHQGGSCGDILVKDNMLYGKKSQVGTKPSLLDPISSTLLVMLTLLWIIGGIQRCTFELYSVLRKSPSFVDQSNPPSVKLISASNAADLCSPQHTIGLLFIWLSTSKTFYEWCLSSQSRLQVEIKRGSIGSSRH